MAQTNIVARHNLPIRRKLLDVKATCPTGSDRTGLKGTERERGKLNLACPHQCGKGLIRVWAFH